jgi:oligopeptide/dipeptide ABC transporter ATP-binding protein
MTVLLDVEHVSKFFPVGGGPNQLARLKRRLSGGAERLPKVYAVDNVSLIMKKGETVGLVGESGCGKSTLVRALARLIDVSGGSIKLGGRELALKPARVFARDRDRARIQMVFQDACDSINPRFTAFDAIADPLRRLRHIRGKTLKERVEVVAGQCGLPPVLLSRFPHQLSGGQRARVGIARAIATEPDLLVLDEPTAALDVSVQAVILQLLQQLKCELGISYLFVSHDLSLVRLLCDHVMVMYLGKIVESGPARAVFEHPWHPYTQTLVAAVPRFAGAAAERLRLKGEPRSPIDPDPNVCRFYGRCPIGASDCKSKAPVLRRIGRRDVACHFAEEFVVQRVGPVHAAQATWQI